jgi:hypothetical protein
LEANVGSLSMKQASYIIIVVYPYGEMQKFGSYQESCVDFFFTCSQQIKLRYGLYTNDDDNWCKLKNSDISGVAGEPKYF